MQKVIIIILVIVGLVCGIIFFFTRDNLSNDHAEKDKNGRYITIVNNTGQVINEVKVTVNNGTEIESMNKKNIDKNSFSIKFPKEYDNYDSFHVSIIDRYGAEYRKSINNVAKKGRTEVVISNDDLVKESDSIKNKIDRFFNGD